MVAMKRCSENLWHNGVQWTYGSIKLVLFLPIQRIFNIKSRFAWWSLMLFSAIKRMEAKFWSNNTRAHWFEVCCSLQNKGTLMKRCTIRVLGVQGLGYELEMHYLHFEDQRHVWSFDMYVQISCREVWEFKEIGRGFKQKKQFSGRY